MPAPADASSVHREGRETCYGHRDAFYACIDKLRPGWTKEVRNCNRPSTQTHEAVGTTVSGPSPAGGSPRRLPRASGGVSLSLPAGVGEALRPAAGRGGAHGPRAAEADPAPPAHREARRGPRGRQPASQRSLSDSSEALSLQAGPTRGRWRHARSADRGAGPGRCHGARRASRGVPCAGWVPACAVAFPGPPPRPGARAGSVWAGREQDGRVLARGATRSAPRQREVSLWQRLRAGRGCCDVRAPCLMASDVA